MNVPTSQDETVVNHDWLQAIDDHPELSTTDLLGAYDLLGVPTDLDDEQRYWTAYHLETYGFLVSRVQPQSRLARLLRRPIRVRYQFYMPSAEAVSPA